MYAPHQSWTLIKNSDCKDFKEKMIKVRERVLDAIGKEGGRQFYKKFLLQKSSRIGFPVDLDQAGEYETIDISITQIDFVSEQGEVLSCSVEKRGSDSHFIYTFN